MAKDHRFNIRTKSGMVFNILKEEQYSSIVPVNNDKPGKRVKVILDASESNWIELKKILELMRKSS